MKQAAGWFAAAITFLAAIAIFSRLVTMKNGPKILSSGASALSRLFNGAFDL